jgi:hypothetical protein
MDEPGIGAEHERWCRGCRCVGSRALSDDERAWMRRLRIAHLRWTALGMMIAPTAMAVGVAVVGLFPQPFAQPAQIAFSVWMMYSILLGIPLTIIVTRDHLSASNRLGADLRAGIVWQFEQPHAPSADETTREEPEPRRFALLPATLRIVSVGDLVPRTEQEIMSEVDPPTGSGLDAPLSLEIVPVRSDLRFRQRALSRPERAELERVSRRLVLPRLSTVVAIVGFAGMIAIVFGTHRAPGTPDTVSGLLSIVMTFAVCGMVLARYARAVWLSQRIRFDLRSGLVVRVETGPSSGTEFLPFSRLIWRAGGAPALWRDRGSAVERLRRSL